MPHTADERGTSPKVLLLKRWLVLVACLRLFSVYIGIFDVNKFRIALIDAQPELVNELYGRLFATWTLLTCGLCLICARNPTNPAIYGATLLSFLAALAHFTAETLVFKTMTWRGAASPAAVAGISSLWMLAGWNYYTVYSKVEDASKPDQAAATQAAAKQD